MRRVFLAIVMLLVFAGAAQALDIMPMEQVKPGMTGTGYSVFSGAKPEPFKAHIIGIVRKFQADEDVILAELEGADLEVSGVIAGMSGSPVYIDGKMIGAVAYAWSWAKKPIAGITPIEQMLEIWDDLDFDESKSALNITAPGSFMASTQEFGRIEMAPIRTPVMMGGFSAPTMDYLREHLENLGMTPMMGGGAAGEEVPGMNDLCPGCVIASPLVSGDFDMTAIGTVTVREGNRILAFGHPFFNQGRVSLPMSGGVVTTVMPVQSVSFKIGHGGDILGTIQRDHLPAIAGTVGPQPVLFPMHVVVDDPYLGRHEEFDVQVAQIKELSHYLIVSVLGEAVSKVAGSSGEVTVSYEIEGRLRDYEKPFFFDDMYYSSDGFFSSYTASALLSLLMNGVKEVQVEELTARMTVTHENMTAELIGFTLDKSKIHPGDVVTAFARLRAFDSTEITKKISFQIPADVKPGLYQLILEGGNSFSGKPSMANIYEFDQYFEELMKWIPENSINVKLMYPEQSFGIEGYEVQGLPTTMHTVIMQSAPPRTNLFDRYDRAVIVTDRVIRGMAADEIIIEKEY